MEILKFKGTLLIFTRIQSFIDLNPIIQALIPTFFTCFVTAMEASLVFLLTDIKRKIFVGMVGFTAGIMLAVIFCSGVFFFHHLNFQTTYDSKATSCNWI